ncbi:MAG: ABC transporter ATP-binding protein [Desulfobulbaceae bacterium]
MRRMLEIKDVWKNYGDTPVIRDLSFSLEQGKIGCLLGPSGCGKTTILRLIAGFEDVTAGNVRIGGEIVSTPEKTVSPHRRNIGMVFQDYALFPHLTVFQNIAFGLHGRKRTGKEATVRELLRVTGLKGTEKKYPHQLSGGQQQRVALARALAPRPSLLLMDEPFSNLDVTLRERLSIEVREILKSYGTTAVMVTHNQQEAFALADRVGVVHGGKLMQWDAPPVLYHHPCSKEVASFIGEGTLLRGEIVDEHRVRTGLGILEGTVGPGFSAQNERTVQVLIRPEDVVHDDASAFRATIVRKTFRGANILYTLRLPGGEHVLSLVESHHDHRLGQELGIVPRVEDLVLYAP